MAFATRELSRHQRLLDLAAKVAGFPPSKLPLPEDLALVRYVLWRRMSTGEGWARIVHEVKLPGPVRPRSLPDALLERIATEALPELPLGEVPLDRAATLYSLPTWLARALAERVPVDEVEPLFAALVQEPALVLRVRPPGTREECIARLGEEEISARPCALAPDAIALEGRAMRVFDSRPMREGRLQVMDLGSQLIVELCRPARGFEGATVVDYCAGAGGKALALADRVGRRGRVLAGDASRRRLEEARRRARRYGLRQIEFPRELRLDTAEVVLIDAPCSGTGVLSREPEQKWRLDPAKVAAFHRRQVDLLGEVAERLPPGAEIVYATCSLLREECEDVVEAFLASHRGFAVVPAGDLLPPEVCAGPWMRLLPHRAEGGGFFAARLKRSPAGD